MATKSKAVTTGKTYDYSMEEVCMSVLGVNRFYATILSKVVKVETNTVPTAAVGFNTLGKICLYYNKDFILSLPLEKAQGIVIHEVLHIFFRHLTRFKIDKTNAHLAKIYNIGMDMAINQYIPHLPEGVVYPETFQMPKEKNADYYIEELKKKANECPKCGSQMQQKSQGGEGQDQQGEGQQGEGQESQDQQGQQGQGQQPQDQKGQQGKGKGKPQDQGQGNQQGQGDKCCPKCGHEEEGGNGQTLDSHDMWDKVIDGEGQVKDCKEFDIDPEYEVTTAVMKSIKECREYGTLPAFVEKEIAALKTIKRHNWKKDLKVFINTVLTSKKKLSQKRVNRRLHDEDYILPGKKKSRNPKLLLVRDTSGSMYDDKVQAELLNEMIQISKSASILVCDCDTKVHQTYEVRKMGDFKSYKGGGGTSFEPAFAEARKLKVDGIVYLTDTFGSFPEKKDIGKFASHTIWVTFNQKDVKLPFGKHVNIDTTAK